MTNSNWYAASVSGRLAGMVEAVGTTRLCPVQKGQRMNAQYSPTAGGRNLGFSVKSPKFEMLVVN